MNPQLQGLEKAIKMAGGMNRRLWLAYCSALASMTAFQQKTEARIVRQPKFEADPFSVGVASGDPSSTGFVIWSRLAPKPLEPSGGMPADLVEVSWAVAEEEGMKKVVRQGKTLATPQLGHSIHVEVEGLKPAAWYYFQFTAGDAKSRVGRSRTTPARDALADQLKFAFASCQHYEQGYFTAYADMLKQSPDLVIHLGDYIYEYKGKDNLVRKHQGDEIQSLDDYRIRHSQYRLDEHLAAMHAACPWLVTWDDHEFDNNCAGAISEEKNVSTIDYLNRRANAYQAYYEMMPLRRRSIPQGPDMLLYRSVAFGQLVNFQVLDTRQYRTDQPNGDRSSPLNEEARRATNSLLGSRQGGWLKSNLLQSTSQWNVLAQQVMMGVANISRTDQPAYSMDQWPGALAERESLMEFIANRRVPNPVVLTGDIHSNWVNDLHVDDTKPEAPVVATEFVGTSISSGGNGSAVVPNLDKFMSRNPGVRYFNTQRGYVLCTVQPESWRSDYRIVEKVTEKEAPVTTGASFIVESDRPGAKKV